jgi:chromatin structure-remodeling complex subunit RSC1/2
LQVIPEPRCIDGIKAGVEKGRYKDAAVVYEDVNLVFANALHYNEFDSQIAKDANTLKVSTASCCD